MTLFPSDTSCEFFYLIPVVCLNYYLAAISAESTFKFYNEYVEQILGKYSVKERTITSV